MILRRAHVDHQAALLSQAFVPQLDHDDVRDERVVLRLDLRQVTHLDRHQGLEDVLAQSDVVDEDRAVVLLRGHQLGQVLRQRLLLRWLVPLSKVILESQDAEPSLFVIFKQHFLLLFHLLLVARNQENVLKTEVGDVGGPRGRHSTFAARDDGQVVSISVFNRRRHIFGLIGQETICLNEGLEDELGEDLVRCVGSETSDNSITCENQIICNKVHFFERLVTLVQRLVHRLNCLHLVP